MLAFVDQVIDANVYIYIYTTKFTLIKYKENITHKKKHAFVQQLH